MKVGEQKSFGFKIRNSGDCAFFIDLTLKNNDLSLSEEEGKELQEKSST